MDIFNVTDLLNPSASKVFFWLRLSRTSDNTSVAPKASNPSPQDARTAMPTPDGSAALESARFVESENSNTR